MIQYRLQISLLDLIKMIREVSTLNNASADFQLHRTCKISPWECKIKENKEPKFPLNVEILMCEISADRSILIRLSHLTFYGFLVGGLKCSRTEIHFPNFQSCLCRIINSRANFPPQ